MATSMQHLVPHWKTKLFIHSWKYFKEHITFMVKTQSLPVLVIKDGEKGFELHPKSVLHFWHIISNCCSYIGRSMELSLYYPWVFFVWPAAGNRRDALVWCSLDVCEMQCSVFQSSVIVHSFTTVQTVHDWLQQIGMVPCSWPVGFCHTLAIA